MMFKTRFDMKKKKIKPPIDEKLFFSLRGTSIQKKPSVQAQVETFNLFGNLKKAPTEIHNSLPSSELIEREMKYISFDEERRNRPHEVGYKDFYQYLTPTVTPVRKNREITSS
ncbi:uncharacterized protein LOC134696582 isoform X1 [Mytilus trossulus]|uniref:uncharacterized protein LOC134696582 isoform X1 n=2 Tax=Mytilus trossulus TaxID=6551 RepID=UPI003003DB38